jgi:hypothetical protein
MVALVETAEEAVVAVFLEMLVVLVVPVLFIFTIKEKL